MDSFLNKEDMKVVKALAIILMLMHHLWAFPDRLMGGELNSLFTIFNESVPMYIGKFGKICVSLFFFGGGYGLYLSTQGKAYDLVSRIKKLYLSYWKVFFIFIPIAVIFMKNQIPYCENEGVYTRYNDFTWDEFFANFLGISWSYNGEWWFLISYCFALISFPFIRKIADKHSDSVNIFIVIIASIVVTNVLPAIGKAEVLGTLKNNYLYTHLICQKAPYIGCFWMGVVAAKGGLLDRLNVSMQANHLLNPVIDIAVLFFIMYMRQMAIGDKCDIFYVPLLITVSMDLINRSIVLRKVLLALGKQSTNMWLIHSFLCYYFYPAVRLVVISGWAVPALLMLICMSYAASVAVNYFWNIVMVGYQSIRKR